MAPFRDLAAITPPATSAGRAEVSVVLPCLDEAHSVALVVRTALETLAAAGLGGEVIVADNGSSDGSAELAREAGARVVNAPLRGYGNAYHAGIAAASGRVLVMADADGTYAMEDIPRLVGPVLDGRQDMIIGSRIRGRIDGGAMPWSHRYIGNPILTTLLNRLFGVRVSDAHSGMRAIDAAAYRRLGLSTPGMEYASEMIAQAARARLRIGEVPIAYRERAGASKLRTWPDGWSHLKFLLLASPNWLFLAPGAILAFVGALLVIPLAFGPLHIGRLQLILHPMVYGAVMMIVGYQMLQLGLLIRACSEPPEGVVDRIADLVRRRLTIERMLLIGLVPLLIGLAIGAAIVVGWVASGFGPLAQIREGIAAMTLVVLGTQTIFGAFVYAFFFLPGSVAV